MLCKRLAKGLPMVAVLAAAMLPLVGCGPATVPAGLDELTKANAIVIDDNDWNGFGPPPYRYALHRNGENFSGIAVRLDVNGAPEQDIVVPSDVIDEFLESLSQTPMSIGWAVPHVVFDASPNFRIRITTSSDTIVFGTDSGSEGFLPWWALVKGIPYVVNSPIPNDALDTLRPHLQASRGVPKFAIADQLPIIAPCRRT